MVGRQIVLGQQVHDHGRLGHLVEVGILRSPVLATQQREVTPTAPRNVVVRIPGLRLREVAVEVVLHHWFQLGEQIDLHGRHRDLPKF